MANHSVLMSSPEYFKVEYSINPWMISGVEVDGMNVLDVKKAVQKALKHTKSGKGPYIIEAMTYRYRGHSMSDPAKYRSRDEVKKVRSESDPIVSFGEYLIEKNLTSETDLKEIDKEIKNIIADAALFAEQSPEPNPEELFTDIYIND